MAADIITTALHLHVKREYFNQMKAGEKLYEYRRRTPYWEKKLVGRDYDFVIIYDGYPHRHEKERILCRVYNGYTKERISHKHFGDNPADVYSIPVYSIPLN